jgi:Protein of unknown function (DUF1588)/Protein of unknown function (DUF1592)/Protein of unknown function (DUF1585)/Protein of unknown function (DUF1595)
MHRMPHRAAALALALALSLSLAACYGGVAGFDGNVEGSTGGSGGEESGSDSPAEPACEPVVPRSVARLPDRHVANAVATLLSIPRPDFSTSPSDLERFVPDQLSAVTGAVAVKLQAMAEAAAAAATAPGRPLVACEPGLESACADERIDELASRAFRRAATPEERAGLRVVYDEGVALGGDHAAGIRLVIEAVLQAPSFIYEIEAPGLDGDDGDEYLLTPEQHAARVAFLLTDTIPDEELWRAARDGYFETPEEIDAQIDRMLATPEGAQQLRTTFGRFFDLHRVSELSKDGVEPALFEAMRAESEGLIDDVLSRPGGTLADLLLSREARVDGALAELYGVPAPAVAGGVVTLPADQRAGILTRAGLMALESTADESSVIHRGLLVTRNLLCFTPPPPSAENVAEGEEINGMYETERERMMARKDNATCSACHSLFDPLGVTFEHYDRVGRYRTEIETSAGPVPVDASWDIHILDIEAQVTNAVELSEQLAGSSVVNQCVTEQFTAYALGRSLDATDRCAVTALVEEFEASGGELEELIRAIAAWPGLRARKGGTP